MAAGEHDPLWISDVFQTELRGPQSSFRRTCILLFPPIGNRPSRFSVTRRAAKTLLSKVRALLAQKTPSMSPAEYDKAAEAYMHACIAMPFFCYVSPALFGLTDSDGEPQLKQDGMKGDAR